jgi:hypothetical protein
MSIVLQGSTSGSVTLQEPAVAGTTVLDLPAVSGTVLTTGSSGQSIPKAALPTGSVLQVVNATYSTTTSTTSGSFVDTGLTATITPLFSTSKILVIVNQAGNYKPSGNTYEQLRLVRNSTAIINMESLALYPNNIIAFGGNTISTTYLDSPATTSATTYKTQFNSGDSSSTVTVQVNNGFTATSTITLMEIAA